jgi:hypothetical protein
MNFAFIEIDGGGGLSYGYRNGYGQVVHRGTIPLTSMARAVVALP